jgi:GAF domain-containing protein
MIAVERLADVFVEVADTLVVGFDLIDFLHTLAQHAADVSGCAVGLVLADEHGRLHYMGASDQSARDLEILQLEQEEGPCLDCFSSGQAVVNTDLADATRRWPSFAPLAVEAGVLSVHAFPMRLRERVIGAMNVFGREAESLTHDEIRVIQAMADVATISIIQEQAIARAEVLTEQLQLALNNRIVIEQAKGAVARALSVSVDEAFELIRARARRERTPLTELAFELVDAPATIERLR